ncbi:MFS transporter, partial [Mycolicibacterium aichiense]|nr:MFS transporter [Mycolicibacterium aichiense]
QFTDGSGRCHVVGAAIGIAVAGSVLAAQYSSALAPALAAFPEQVRDAAADSLAAAMEIAQQLGPAGARLVEAATAAFIDAMGLSLVVLATALAVVAAIVAVWAPGRDGEQFGFLARRAESPDEPSADEL